jgi:tRNA nucleotidyltransferase (CCA-adding enzyme)
MEKMLLPKNVEYILNTLHGYGFKANLVGGTVRDFLMGISQNDYDITTSASPNEIKQAFSSERIIESGIKHGTVTLLIGGEGYEITTYRLDGDYLDNRHPSTVTFTKSLFEDTARRDFTMNAVCYNEIDGFSDFHGGINDIKEGIIRTVGEPVRRFREDALRILRALRFAATLGFSIEKNTKDAIFSLSNLIKNVSAERIFAEFKKLIAGKFAYSVITEYKDVLKLAIPKLSSENLPKKALFDKASPFIRMLSLFKSKEDYEDAMHALRSDAKTLKDGALILENKNMKTSERFDMLTALNLLGKELTEKLIDFKILNSLSEYEEKKKLDLLLSEKPAYRTSHLQISGNDLLPLGFFGEKIGKALNLLLHAVMRGEISNERDALLDCVIKNLK